ncbi:hypothetical protein MIND_00964000 [Mycena indigotica]|uniref:F-box domain-containing protein n=1 Tax=Mycena indigotica TaxID=2126181 RepID=A0A8H6SE62_9AGAR|nr:uncharacterized protein MIND_00964000 [Mycena indigotica]KAF7297307.1 hypothetical protein MIND_00964000 [Mycena indigotica]
MKGQLSRRKSQAPLEWVLPVELWELILDEMSDGRLVEAAKVCRALNTLALRLYFRRNKMEACQGALDIRSHLLRALFLAVHPSEGVRSLTVTFWTFGKGRSVLMLRDIVERWPSLTEVNLSWRHNILTRHPDMEAHSSRKPVSAAAFLSALWEVVVLVAQRCAASRGHGGSEAAVVVADGALHRCDSGALAAAKLTWRGGAFGAELEYVFPRRPGRVRRVLNTVFRAQAPPAYSARLEAHARPQFVVRSRTGADIRITRIGGIRVGPLAGGGALIQVDTDYLRLRPDPGLDVAALLPHLRLPSLATVEIGVPDIAPAAFSQFLDNHALLWTFQLTCLWSPKLPSPPSRVSAAATGGTYTVTCRDPAHIAGLPDFLAATLPSHPDLRVVVSIPWRRSTPADRIAAARVFAHLGARHPGPSYPALRLPPDFAAAPPANAAEIAALASLARTPSVTATCPAPADAHALLPLLAHLPALRHLYIRLDRPGPGSDATHAWAALQAAAATVLPGVRLAVLDEEPHVS